MLIKKNTSVYLFKTPLRNDYSNVYNGFSSHADYLNFLVRTFLFYNVTVTKETSRSDANGRFRLEISGKTSHELHDYNYLAFRASDTDEWAFAFINSVSSLNDGISPNTSSTAIDCNLDAWANEMMFLSDSNKYKTVRYTLDPNLNENKFRYSHDIGPFHHYDTLSAQYVSTLLMTKVNIPSTVEPRIVWLRIYVDYTLVGKISGEPDVPQIYGLSRDFKGIVEMPICLLNGNTPLFPANVRYLGYNRQHFREFTQTSDLPRLGLWLQGEYILKAELTFFPSFQYTLEYSAGYYNIYPNDSDIEVIDIDTVTKPYATTHLRVYSHLSSASTWKCPLNYSIDISPISYAPRDTDLANRYAEIFSEPNKYMYEAYRYPFFRKCIFANNNVIPITTENTSSNISLSVNIYGSDQPSICIECGDIDYNFQIHTVMASKGEINTAIENLDSYLNRNRNQLQGGMINTIINSAAGMVSSGVGVAVSGNPIGAFGIVGSAAHGITNLISLQMKYLDEKNIPTMFNAPIKSATEDLIEQNDIIIATQTCYYYHKIEAQEILKDIHDFGGIYSAHISIGTRSHDIFDFIQINDNLRVYGLSNDDYQELNNAFNRGVRIWHCNGYDSDSTRRTILQNMKTDVLNIPYSKL